MMTKKLLVGNWKMNGEQTAVARYQAIFQQNQNLLDRSAVSLCVMPPYLYLSSMQDLVRMGVYLGGQNLSQYEQGAYTGEVSAAMLKDMQCQFALIGHSERRQFFHEQGEILQRKYQLCCDHGIIPILCVGETLAQREQEQTFSVLQAQLDEVLARTSEQTVYIAYEPVWAIGTGVSANKADIEEVHNFIKQAVYAIVGQNALVKVLYGGSVTEHNAKELLNAMNVDGGLVGGASLDAARFLEIAKCINSFY